MSDLDRLFYWRGIAADYLNYRGEHVDVPLENRLTLLETMGLDISNAEAVAEAAYELDVGPWRHFIPPLQTYVVQSDENQAGFYVNLHPDRLGMELAWSIADEGGTVIEKGALLPKGAPEVGDYVYNGSRYSRRLIHTETKEPGYYNVTLTLAETHDKPISTLKETPVTIDVSGRLAIAPYAVYQPGWLAEQQKLWGFIIQLYTIRSASDWGIGDFSDLEQLIVKSASHGADLIGLNPLHALLPDVAEHSSPYSPSDRRFINPLYIDPKKVAGYDAVVAKFDAEVQSQHQELLAELRSSEQVDYARVKVLKYQVLEKIFDNFFDIEYAQETPQCGAFKKFIIECGEPLLQFAVYESNNNDWQGARYGKLQARLDVAPDFTLEELAGLPVEIRKTILFHCYLQWLAHDQLAACQQLAENIGMKVGLVRDLAVGAEGGGAEVSSNPGQFCTRASVGAPPDPLAEQGQNWGLPPMDPAFLRETGFAHYIQILRENMSRCGALRIDHAMSLMRLWWCPPGTTADHGAYVYYPFEDMLALLCLESHLNKCAIVGEDLGVVPHEFREAITHAGIFTNRVFYFEKENYTHFKPPENYDVHALAMVNNHDVPTLKSWWDGNDLILRDKLGIFEEGVDYDTMVEQRRFEKQQVLDFLLKLGTLPAEWLDLEIEKPANESLISAILATVSRVASWLYVIQLEDVILMEAPVNVPGTYKEYPNWQRKLSAGIEEIFDNKNVQALLSRVNAERNS